MEGKIHTKENREKGFLKGLFYKNPVLVRIIGIGPVVAAAYSLKNGIALCVIMLVLFVSTGFFSFFLGSFFSQKTAVPAYVIFSAIMLIPAYLLCNLILPGTVDALGVFAPIMMVNTLIISRSDKYGSFSSLLDAIIDALGNVCGFAVVVLFVSAVREIFAFGTLFDISLGELATVEGLRLPFAGYIILGLTAALLRNIRRRIRDKREEQEANE